VYFLEKEVENMRKLKKLNAILYYENGWLKCRVPKLNIEFIVDRDSDLFDYRISEKIMRILRRDNEGVKNRSVKSR
jgi:hypothetical protein